MGDSVSAFFSSKSHVDEIQDNTVLSFKRTFIWLEYIKFISNTAILRTNMTIWAGEDLLIVLIII